MGQMRERLTDEQLRDIAAGVMISDRVVDLSDAMAVELLALRARVAKLEAALKDVRIDFEMWHEKTSIAKIDAALKDAPE